MFKGDHSVRVKQVSGYLQIEEKTNISTIKLPIESNTAGSSES